MDSIIDYLFFFSSLFSLRLCLIVANLGTAPLLSQLMMIHIPIIANVQFVLTPIDIDRYTFGVNGIYKRRVWCSSLIHAFWSLDSVHKLSSSIVAHCPRRGDKKRWIANNPCPMINVPNLMCSVEPTTLLNHVHSMDNLQIQVNTNAKPSWIAHNPCIMANVHLFFYSNFKALQYPPNVSNAQCVWSLSHPWQSC